MQRIAKEPTFVDGAVADLGGPRTGRFLERVDQVIDWDHLTGPLVGLTPAQPKGGRPFWPLTVMVKFVLLAKWYGLKRPAARRATSGSAQLPALRGFELAGRHARRDDVREVPPASA